MTTRSKALNTIWGLQTVITEALCVSTLPQVVGMPMNSLENYDYITDANDWPGRSSVPPKNELAPSDV